MSGKEKMQGVTEIKLSKCTLKVKLTNEALIEIEDLTGRGYIDISDGFVGSDGKREMSFKTMSAILYSCAKAYDPAQLDLGTLAGGESVGVRADLKAFREVVFPWPTSAISEIILFYLSSIRPPEDVPTSSDSKKNEPASTDTQ